MYEWARGVDLPEGTTPHLLFRNLTPDVQDEMTRLVKDDWMGLRRILPELLQATEQYNEAEPLLRQVNTMSILCCYIVAGLSVLAHGGNGGGVFWVGCAFRVMLLDIDLARCSLIPCLFLFLFMVYASATGSKLESGSICLWWLTCDLPCYMYISVVLFVSAERKGR